jgi:arylsulfatase
VNANHQVCSGDRTQGSRFGRRVQAPTGSQRFRLSLRHRIPEPQEVDGIEQAPMEGTSFAYTFDAANANAESRHKTQYFEMMGQWALYHEGWLLATKVDRAPWEAYGAAKADPLNDQVFQLYDLTTDFSQSKDLADQHPEKVTELRQLFVEEAQKYQVFPMDASVATRVIAPRPNITAGRTEFVYTRPMTGLPQGDSPLLLNTSYKITAEITVPQDGADDPGASTQEKTENVQKAVTKILADFPPKPGT